ncbi:hypothetical protein KSP40_PGU020757 [Platanthera guangdongensis]|uniref:Uncharacterized protein n=1 Tax=Platanthera guangdongensis TaxID=2320717 RepID=A0ABR2N2M4_9ASPA
MAVRGGCKQGGLDGRNYKRGWSGGDKQGIGIQGTRKTKVAVRKEQTAQGYGFHEDGLKAGLTVAYNILGKEFKPLKNPRHMVPSLMEVGARMAVTKFLEHYISTGTLTAEPLVHAWRKSWPEVEAGPTLDAQVMPSWLDYGAEALSCSDGKIGSRFGRPCSAMKNGVNPAAFLVSGAVGSATSRKCSWASWERIATEADIGLADAYINGCFSFVDEKDGLLNLLLVLIANRDLRNSFINQSKRGWWTPLLVTASVSSARSLGLVVRRPRTPAPKDNINPATGFPLSLGRVITKSPTPASSGSRPPTEEDVVIPQPAETHVLHRTSYPPGRDKPIHMLFGKSRAGSSGPSRQSIAESPSPAPGKRELTMPFRLTLTYLNTSC